MEVQTAILAFIVFVVASVVLILISLLGTKEKSYEDAIAEQRQQTSALLGIQARPKPKDKKQKKANKKVKEKQVVSSTAGLVDDSEYSETGSLGTGCVSSSSKGNLHVEFQKPTIIEVLSEEIQIPNILAKQKNVKKVRPILVQKDDSKEVRSLSPITDVPPANHFEKILPKDEFELIRSRSNSQTREEQQKFKPTTTELDSKEKQEFSGKTHKNEQSQVLQENSKEKHKDIPIDAVKGNKKTKKKEGSVQQNENEKESEETPEAIVDEIVQNSLNAPPVKEKRKKKGESNILQKISGSTGEVNVQLLIDMVRTAELSHSDVQILIDLLLNKQHEGSPNSEWSEGKTDPIQKLKKQLAEKEKLLSEEQLALSGAQAKLREIRSEHVSERTQQLQKIKNLEETLQGKHLELQASNQRFHSQNQKLQQLQSQLNEEAILVHNLREEQANWGVQRQQLEMRLSQAQDAETTIVQLRNEMQDLQNRNNQLTIELHSLSDQSIAAKEHQQNLIVQLQHQLSCFKNEVDQKDEYIRKHEESRRDLEHRLKIEQIQQNELKVEISQLKTAVQQNIEEVRRLELGKSQALEELKKVDKQKDDWGKKKDELEKALAKAKLQLETAEEGKKEFQKLQQNSLSNEINNYQKQIKNLQNDLKTVTNDFQENERKYNEEVSKYGTQINTLQNDLNNIKKANEHLIRELNEYKETYNVLTKEIQDVNQRNVKLEEELNEQRIKNDEIRKKNWKVVEALNAAENKLKSFLNSPKQRSPTKNTQEKVVMQQDFRQQTEELVKDVDNEEISRLQTEINNYRSVIDNTEGVLRNLEAHIEREELSWRNQLNEKDLEIEKLKEKHVQELKCKVSELEIQLSNEKLSKENLKRDYESLKNNQTMIDNSGIVEKLSEEVNRLNEQLELVKRQNLEYHQKMYSDVSNNSEKVQNGAPNNNLTQLLTQTEIQ